VGPKASLDAVAKKQILSSMHKLNMEEKEMNCESSVNNERVYKTGQLVFNSQ